MTTERALNSPLELEPEQFISSEDDWQDPERFKIDSKSKADWAIRKLRQYRDRVASNQELYAAEVENLKQWLDGVNATDLRSIEYFEAILRHWHLAQLDEQDAAWEDKKDKTLPLPGGTLKAHRSPAHLDVDEAVFVPWARDNRPEWVETKYQPKKAEIKKAKTDNGKIVVETGEIVPGVDLVEGDIKWEAKF